MGDTAEPTRRVWMNYREASAYSGLSRTYLWQKITAGELRAYRSGRAVRIHSGDLDRFLRRESAATTDGS